MEERIREKIEELECIVLCEHPVCIQEGRNPEKYARLFIKC